MNPPPIIPDHTLLRPIGRGAYGEVWLARNIMGAWRAVKVVWRNRFESERPYEREFAGVQGYEPVSRTAGGLVHVLHVGRDDAAGCFYYVMELADPAGEVISESVISNSVGIRADVRPVPLITDALMTDYSPRTLRSDLQHHRLLPTAEALRLALDVVGGLARLHEQGLVHRDVKPGNIIFVDGRAKLADIGLVSAEGETQTFVGTEGYVPREGPGTPRADLCLRTHALRGEHRLPARTLSRSPGAVDGRTRRRRRAGVKRDHSQMLRERSRAPLPERAPCARLGEARGASPPRRAAGGGAAHLGGAACRVLELARARGGETSGARNTTPHPRRARRARRAHPAVRRVHRPSPCRGAGFRRGPARTCARSGAPGGGDSRHAGIARSRLRRARAAGHDRGARHRSWSRSHRARLPQFSADGRFIAFKQDRNLFADLEVWNLTTTQRLFRATDAVVKDAFAWHPRAPRLLVARPDLQLVEWDVTGGGYSNCWPMISAAPQLAYAPD